MQMSSPAGSPKVFVVLAVVGAVFVLLLIGAAGVGYFYFTREPERSGASSDGKEEPTVLATSTIKSTGGTIEISDAASEIRGMTVKVPPGAYASDTPFTISTIPFRESSFGKFFDSARAATPDGMLFNPITPVIKVDNGEIVAREPLTLTIPIRKTKDEFAMAFYCDGATGKLEGIPTEALSDTSITIATSHFSSIIVSSAPISELEGLVALGISTGYTPGVDDFQMPNYGSRFAPGGHCAGQSIAAMYYFIELKKGKGAPGLYGLLDNNKKGGTPDFWLDDSWAVRLCTAVHCDIDTASVILNAQRNLRGVFDPFTFLAFAYSMSLTGEPQYVTLGQPGVIGGHAIVAYKIDRTGLYVADPNFPKTPRRILLKNENALPMLREFQPYGSGENAQAVKKTETAYDRIGYIGKSSMLDWAGIGRRWAELPSGKIGQDIFRPEEEPIIEVMTGRDAGDNPVYARLVDGYKTNRKTAEMYTGLPGKLRVRITAKIASGYVEIYRGVTALDAFYPKTTAPSAVFDLPLAVGHNDFGVYVTREVVGRKGYYFVNFTRHDVAYSDAEDEIITPPPPDNVEGPTDGKTLRKQTMHTDPRCGTEFVEFDYEYSMKDGKEVRNGTTVEYDHTHLLGKDYVTYKWKESTWKDGKLDGPYVEYFPYKAGEAVQFLKKEECVFKDGVRTGTSTHRYLIGDKKMDDGRYARVIMKYTRDNKTLQTTPHVVEEILEVH